MEKRLLVSYKTLAHAFFTQLFDGREIVQASVHDTKRSSNWPIARSGPKTWPRLVSHGPFGIFLNLWGGFGRGRPYAPSINAADATADDVEHAAADGPHTNS